MGNDGVSMEYLDDERKKLWAELRSTQAELATLSRALEESGNPLANMINQGGRFAAAVERVASTPGLEMIINLLQKSKEHGQRKESVSGEAGPGPDGATS